MKGKVIRGKGFRGALEYLLAKLKKAEIVAGNLLGRTPWTLSREFGVVRQILPDCEKPVLHIPLRLPPGDTLTNPVWTEIALRYFELMELSTDRPWILIRHDEHVHLLTSRISYAGELWYGKWEGLKHITATQTLEKEFDLTRTPGLEGADAKQARLTSGQLAQYQRECETGKTPEVPGKTYIAESIELALAQCDGSMNNFEEHLQILGVTTLINQGKTSLVTGISFKFGEVKIKGSKVARAYSWKNLLKLLAERKKNYELERNTQENATTSPDTNPERIATGPAGAIAGRTVGHGDQNRDVAGNASEPDTAIPAAIAPIPDVGNGHHLLPDGRSDVAAIPPAHPANAIEQPGPPASPTTTDQRTINGEGEHPRPEHLGDMQLAEETRSRVPEHNTDCEPELTSPSELEQEQEQNQAPPSRGR